MGTFISQFCSHGFGLIWYEPSKLKHTFSLEYRLTFLETKIHN